MRKILYIYIIGITVLLVGCAQEEIQPGAKGWLSLESLSVNGEDLLHASTTRGIDEGLNVDILNAEGELINKYTSANADELRRIELEAGTYTLKAYSANYETTYTNDELGAAKYFKETPFTIIEDKMTSVRVAVPMTNYAVSLKLPEGFTDHMTVYGLRLTSGTRKVTIQEEQEEEVAYFDVDADGFTYELSATNADEESFATGVITYKPVEGGKHYKVTYTYDSEGGFDVDVDDGMTEKPVEPPL